MRTGGRGSLSPRNIRLAEVELTCWAPGLFWLRVPGEVERTEGLANLSKNLGDSIEAATLNSTASQHCTPSKSGTQMPQIEAVRKRASFRHGVSPESWSNLAPRRGGLLRLLCLREIE